MCMGGREGDGNVENKRLWIKMGKRHRENAADVIRTNVKPIQANELKSDVNIF